MYSESSQCFISFLRYSVFFLSCTLSPLCCTLCFFFCTFCPNINWLSCSFDMTLNWCLTGLLLALFHLSVDLRHELVSNLCLFSCLLLSFGYIRWALLNLLSRLRLFRSLFRGLFPLSASWRFDLSFHSFGCNRHSWFFLRSDWSGCFAGSGWLRGNYFCSFLLVPFSILLLFLLRLVFLLFLILLLVTLLFGNWFSVLIFVLNWFPWDSDRSWYHTRRGTSRFLGVFGFSIVIYLVAVVPLGTAGEGCFTPVAGLTAGGRCTVGFLSLSAILSSLVLLGSLMSLSTDFLRYGFTWSFCSASV